MWVSLPWFRPTEFGWMVKVLSQGLIVSSRKKETSTGLCGRLRHVHVKVSIYKIIDYMLCAQLIPNSLRHPLNLWGLKFQTSSRVQERLGPQWPTPSWRSESYGPTWRKCQNDRERDLRKPCKVAIGEGAGDGFIVFRTHSC